MVSLYPALVAPLSYALQAPDLDGARVADHLFWATSRVLDVFEGSLPLTRKLRVLDDELRSVLGCVLGLAHRTSLHHAPRVRQLCAWAADCAAARHPDRTTILALRVTVGAAPTVVLEYGLVSCARSCMSFTLQVPGLTLSFLRP